MPQKGFKKYHKELKNTKNTKKYQKYQKVLKWDNKFAEITLIFITNMSLGPKIIFTNCYNFFVHVDIIIILDFMTKNHTFSLDL